MEADDASGRDAVQDLRAMGTKTVTTTMECAGNNRLGQAPLPSGEPWQAGAVSTATDPAGRAVRP